MWKVLEKLVELQEVAKVIFDLNEEKKSIPAKIEEIEKRLSDIKDEIEIKEKEIKQIENSISAKQKEIQVMNDKIMGLKEKEKMVTTQREYDSLEIENALYKENKTNLEKEIDEEKKKLKEVTKSLEEMKKTLGEEEEALIEEKEELNSRLQTLEKNIKENEKVKESIIPNISENILKTYFNIVENKNGIGIVPVVNGICEGCNMLLPPQFVNEVRRANSIHTCPNCARILYYPYD